MRGLVGVGGMVVLLVGCGAQVVFDGEGTGGTGQGGSTSSQGASSQGGTTSSSPGPSTGGSTSSGPGDLCQQLCTQFPECIGGGMDCIQSCNALFVPGCEAQAADLLSCALSNLKPGGNCELPPGLCDAQGLAYSQCTNGSQCATTTCSIGDAICSCDADCGGFILSEECSIGVPPPGPPPAGVFCNCFIDGNFIGSCNQDVLACDLESGCCQGLL